MCRKVKRVLTLFSSCVVAVSLTSCYWYRTDIVKVSVTFIGSKQHPEIGHMTVISGGDKAGWYHVKSGETASTNLFPDPDDNRQLDLSYGWTEAVENMYWQGPAIPAGQGYRIHVTIDARVNQVTERHCFLPCSLD